MSTMSYDREGNSDRVSRVLPHFLSRVAGGIRSYITKADAERQLEGLDERLLNDIGLKRSEIRRMVWGGDR